MEKLTLIPGAKSKGNPFENTLDFAKQLDKEDPLKAFVKNFTFLLFMEKKAFILQVILWAFSQKLPRNIF